MVAASIEEGKKIMPKLQSYKTITILRSPSDAQSRDEHQARFYLRVEWHIQLLLELEL